MEMRTEYYEKKITVMCNKCRDMKNEIDVKFIDVQKKSNGTYIWTFECPDCKTIQKSKRF